MLLDALAQNAKPRPAILVRERNASPHLVLVRRRMEVIRIFEDAAQPLCQHGADERLSAAAHAHEDES